LLKGEWKFSGFVISDACAVGGANALHMTAHDYTDATEYALKGGLDVIFQTSYDHYPLFIKAFRDGRIPPAVIDSAVARVLRAKFELGVFENPYVDLAEAARLNGSKEHRQLALEAARKSIVLLKNENHLLPLPKALRTIAVIGRDAVEARLGGYSGPGNDRVNILEGIKKKLRSPGRVLYAKGVERVATDYVTVPSENLLCSDRGSARHGLVGEYFSNISLSGKPVFTRVDPQVQFQWTLYSPDPEKLNYDFYSVRWNGKLKGPLTGTCRIGIDGNDGYRLYIDGKLLLDNWEKVSRRTLLSDFRFEKGKEYEIRIEYFEPTGNAWFRLVWDAGVKDESERELQQAVKAAGESDVVLVVAGIEEGEFRDRASLSLPGRQEELINRLAATGRPVAVVLVGGSAVTMSRWLGNVQALIDVWYPGEAGGEAVADVLFGDENPGGRLPITFPASEGQLPLVYNHKPTGRGDDYLDLTGQPLFPFGYGLSYTTFEDSGLRFDREVIGANEKTNVRFTLKNTGPVGGDEVVQLYIKDLLASVARPVMELKGFKRIHLEPGESSEVVFAVGPEILTMLNRELLEVVEGGEFRVMIGASSKDIRLSGTLVMK
jgi:beta-glucosidase